MITPCGAPHCNSAGHFSPREDTVQQRKLALLTLWTEVNGRIVGYLHNRHGHILNSIALLEDGVTDQENVYCQGNERHKDEGVQCEHNDHCPFL
jgi:hypothetical protein